MAERKLRHWSQLLACALGALAKPFEYIYDKPFEAGSRTQYRADLAIAESNYYLARRRIGLLGGSIVRSQCYFWSGVYLMYTLRPVEAWQHILQASSTYHIYLKGQVKGSESDATYVSKNRFLEQRLYWSCFKSEWYVLWSSSLSPWSNYWKWITSRAEPTGVRHCDYQLSGYVPVTTRWRRCH
jgi:hypothetical protein